MIRNALVILVLLLPTVASAASIRIGALYFPATETTTTLITSPATTSFDGAIAPELGLALPIVGNFEVELSAALIESDVAFDFRTLGGELGSTELVPISASLHYVAPLSLLQLYGGGGVTHLMLGDFDEEVSGIDDLELEDDTTWHASAGVRIPISRFSLDVGAMYLPVETTFTAPQREPLELQLEPLMYRAAIRLNF